MTAPAGTGMVNGSGDVVCVDCLVDTDCTDNGLYCD